MEKAKSVTEDALQTIHERNRRQYYGVHQLIVLCQEVGLVAADGQ
ncbi:hypothetical protein [Paenibacillus glycinis]|nr:hypothetical protein [Paenibacillus glycinis]